MLEEPAALIASQIIFMLVGIVTGVAIARDEVRSRYHGARAIVGLASLGVAVTTITFAVRIKEAHGATWEVARFRCRSCTDDVDGDLFRAAGRWGISSENGWTALSVGAVAIVLLAAITFRPSKWPHSVAGGCAVIGYWALAMSISLGMLWPSGLGTQVVGWAMAVLLIPVGIRRVQVATTSLPPPLLRGSWPDPEPPRPA